MLLLLLRYDALRRADYEALREFYNATGGLERKWIDRTGWMGNQTLVGWKGVELNGEGRVKKLLLKQNGCTGDSLCVK